MALLQRKQNSQGLTALGIYPQGVAVVRIGAGENGNAPSVELWDYRPTAQSKSLVNLLGKLSLDYGLDHTRCITVLDDQEYKLILTDAPDVPAEEVPSTLRWQIKKMVDFPVHDAAIDFIEFPQPSGAAEVKRLYTVVAKNEAITQRVELFSDAGIRLRVIDIPEMAQHNLVNLLPEADKPIAMLSFHRHSILITLHYRGLIYLARRIYIGLDSQAGEHGVSGHYQQIILELQRSTEYLETHYFDCPAVDRVVLAPSPMATKELTEHLRNAIDIPIMELDLTQILSWKVTPPSSEVLGRCFATIGAALRREGVRA